MFVEQNHKAMTCIRENLTFTKLAKQAVLLQMDVVASVLKRLEGKYQFDYIFMDPPYRKMLEKQALEYLFCIKYSFGRCCRDCRKFFGYRVFLCGGTWFFCY